MVRVMSGLALTVWTLFGCSGIRYVRQEAIEVSGPGDSVAKLAFVRSFVTQERYDRMRQAARARFPELTETQSRQLFLRWHFNKSLSGGKTTVTILVGMASSLGLPDSPAVLAFCRDQVEAEVMEALRAQGLAGSPPP